MTIRYAGGSYQRASGTSAAFAGLSRDLVAEGYPPITVNSGDREPEAQEAIFRDKYRPSSGPNDKGPYGDRRYWPGHGWWKRVKGGGTVGVPLTSNHEKRRAADLAYPYNSDTAAHRRAKVLAKRHNITCEGENFSEKWHWTFWGDLGTINGPATAGTAKEWDEMATKQEIADAFVDVLTRHGAGPGGRPVFDSLKFLASLVDAKGNAVIDAVPGRVWAHPIAAQDGTGHVVTRDGKPVTFQAQGYLASGVAQLGAKLGTEVDEQELAKALAPLLTANLSALSDADVKRIAEAAADEQARRLNG